MDLRISMTPHGMSRARTKAPSKLFAFTSRISRPSRGAKRTRLARAPWSSRLRARAYATLLVNLLIAYVCRLGRASHPFRGSEAAQRFHRGVPCRVPKAPSSCDTRWPAWGPATVGAIEAVAGLVGAPAGSRFALLEAALVQGVNRTRRDENRQGPA